MGMGSMGMDSMGMEDKSSIFDMIEKLPLWAQTIVGILFLIAASAIVGHIVGRMYAMVRYPDPEKQGVVHPVIKLIFICLLAGCCAWLYMTAMKQNEPADELNGEIGAQSEYDIPAEENYGIAAY